MNGQTRILVTGAGGFIGARLCRVLAAGDCLVRAAVRNSFDARQKDFCENLVLGDILEGKGWKEALAGVDIVVHCAGRAHVLRETAKKPLDEYRRVNVLGTQRLARLCCENKVRRLVFLSTAKVNGESTGIPGEPAAFTEEDIPSPQDDYSVSKMEAENTLKKISSESGLETVILRPPLVYGAGAKANFRQLVNLVSLGLPLPFKSIRNRRSFIYVDTLCSAIRVCCTDPAAAGNTFMVSDSESVSTRELVEAIAFALQKKVLLFNCPPWLLRSAARSMGLGHAVTRLTGSLVIDSGLIRTTLGWRPEITFREAINRSVRRLE